MQGLNVSAHEESVTADAVVSKVESITRDERRFLHRAIDTFLDR